MKNLHTARATLLSAAVCAALAGAGTGGASILSPDLTDVIGQNDARHLARQAENLAPSLEQLLEPFNYQDVDAASHFMTSNAMAMQLEGHGLSKTGRGFMDNQQFDYWYSAAEDRSVVCVTGTNGGRYSQTAYVMPGKVRRTDATPF